MQSFKYRITDISQFLKCYIGKNIDAFFRVCLRIFRCSPTRRRYILLGVYSPPSAFRVSVTNLHSHPHKFSLSSNHRSGHCESPNLALRAIRHDSKFFIAHSVLLVVLVGHSPFLKVSKSSSPISRLNRSSWRAAALFWSFLLPVATAGLSEHSSEATRFLRRFNDSGRRVNGLEYTVSTFFN